MVNTIRFGVPVNAPAPVMFAGDSVAYTLGLHTKSAAARSGMALANDATLGCGVARGGRIRYFGAVSTPPAECVALYATENGSTSAPAVYDSSSGRTCNHSARARKYSALAPLMENPK